MKPFSFLWKMSSKSLVKCRYFIPLIELGENLFIHRTLQLLLGYMGSTTIVAGTRGKENADGRYDSQVREAILDSTNVYVERREPAIRTLGEVLSGTNGFSAANRVNVLTFLEDQQDKGNLELIRKVNAEKNKFLLRESLQ
jgi:hypothetical protein